jgi:excisionase family DNA binding protein
MADDRWLSVEEIAAHLGVVKDSVYRWIEQRGLPAHKVGKLWKFDRGEVDDWVRSGGAGNRAATPSSPAARTPTRRKPARTRRA